MRRPAYVKQVQVVEMYFTPDCSVRSISSMNLKALTSRIAPPENAMTQP